MKIALLADIHGNNFAFQAVREDVEKRHIDEYWFLGDLVGRGPDPEIPLQWLLNGNEKKVILLGNHEVILANKLLSINRQYVDPLTLETIAKHRNSPEIKDWLETHLLPRYMEFEKVNVRENISEAHIVIAHASCDDPLGVRYGYLYSWYEGINKGLLDREFEELKKNSGDHKLVAKCFGHTHVPTLVSSDKDGKDIRAEWVRPFKRYDLAPERLWLINPGSIGAPRDLDTRASYAVLEIDENGSAVTFFRVSYDLKPLRDRLNEKGYPLQTFEKFFKDAKTEKKTPPAWIKHYEEMRNVNNDEKI